MTGDQRVIPKPPSVKSQPSDTNILPPEKLITNIRKEHSFHLQMLNVSKAHFPVSDNTFSVYNYINISRLFKYSS